MAINKSNTSPAMKAMIIVLIIAFVVGFIPLIGGFFSNPGAGTQQTNGSTTATSTVAGIDAKYQPQVAALNSILASEPTSYTALVSLGNSYFDWAIEKQQLSTTSTEAVGADAPLWIAAKDAYGRALAVKDDESAVKVDYSITVFYSGDTKGAIALATEVTKADPTFAPAYFNLGVFQGAAGNNAEGIAAFTKYLELDPEGKQGGNADFAKQQIETLKAAK